MTRLHRVARASAARSQLGKLVVVPLNQGAKPDEGTLNAPIRYAHLMMSALSARWARTSESHSEVLGLTVGRGRLVLRSLDGKVLPS